MTKTNKGRVFVKRWAVARYDSGLVDFYQNQRTWAVDSLAQMRYREFLWIFGIPLTEEVVYELRGKATVKPIRQPQEKRVTKE